MIRATASTQGADKAPDGDEDQDGLPDYWEQANSTNPLVNDLQSDPDLDGLTNGVEHSIGTNPQDSDTDDGREGDGSELFSQKAPFDPTDDGVRIPEELDI